LGVGAGGGGGVVSGVGSGGTTGRVGSSGPVFTGSGKGSQERTASAQSATATAPLNQWNQLRRNDIP
jgi:hypothetical protein